MQIPFIWRSCHGRPDALWSVLFNPWLADCYQGTLVFYRPLVPFTLAADLLAGGGNSVWFHASNLLYQTACTAFLYIAGRRLMEHCRLPGPRGTAFAGSALFAAFPLHAEVVNFIGARCDSLCALFSLVSLVFFQRCLSSGGRLSRVFSLGAFVLALASKEMAVTLPAVLCAYSFFFAQAGPTRVQRIRAALAGTCPYWILTLVFLLVRHLVTGSACAGYVGSLSQYFDELARLRCLSPSWLWKIIYPFDAARIASGSFLFLTVQALYLLAAVKILLCVARGAFTPAQRAVCGFLLLWAFFWLLPVVRCLDLGENLAGARHFYLMSAPLCLLVATLVLSPLATLRGSGASGKSSPVRRINLARLFCLGSCDRVLSLSLLGALILCFGLATRLNNQSWAQAGCRLQALQRSLSTNLALLNHGMKAAVLNLPLDLGDGMSYTYPAIRGLLQEPFASQHTGDGDLTALDGRLFIAPDVLNVSRLERLYAAPGSCVSFLFDSANLVLREIQPHFNHCPLKIIPCGRHLNNAGQLIGVDMLCQPPECLALGAECLELTVRTRQIGPCPPGAKPSVFLQWTDWQGSNFDGSTLKILPLVVDGKPHQYTFDLSQYKDWVLAGRIPALRVMFPGWSHETELIGARLVERFRLIPVLKPVDSSAVETAAGELISKDSSFSFSFDVSNIAQAGGIKVEISLPEGSFQSFARDYRQETKSCRLSQSFFVRGVKGQFSVPSSTFSVPASYQIRIGAIAFDGTLKGLFSDPLQLRLTRAFPNQRRSP